MKSIDYLEEINSHVKKIYENEIQEVSENNNIANCHGKMPVGIILIFIPNLPLTCWDVPITMLP